MVSSHQLQLHSMILSQEMKEVGEEGKRGRTEEGKRGGERRGRGEERGRKEGRREGGWVK